MAVDRIKVIVQYPGTDIPDKEMEYTTASEIRRLVEGLYPNWFKNCNGCHGSPRYGQCLRDPKCNMPLEIR